MAATRNDMTRSALDRVATDLVADAIQLGMDKAAEHIAGHLGEVDDDPQTAIGEYRDGVEDALLVLIKAGANDPRKD